MQTHPDFFSAVATLNAVKVLDVDAMKLLYRVENAGEDFYSGLANRIGNPQAADLLRRNGREERGHAERVGKAIGIKTGRPYDPTPEELERYPVPLPETITPELFAMIVKAELDGDKGYQNWADQETDPEVQRLLRLNGREETVHSERVATVMALLQSTTR